MFFRRRVRRITPGNIAKIENNFPAWQCLAQPEGDNRASGIESMGDFTFYVGGGVGIFGEDNDDQATGIDGLPGRLCPIFAR